MDKLKEMKRDDWQISPITKRQEVLLEHDERFGKRKMCIGSGFFTNEYPLNYKKNPDFKIEGYEKNMPQLMKDLRFDDGESYWYPSTIQLQDGIVFPDGKSKEDWKWCYAPIEQLEDKDKVGEYESKINMEKAERFDRFLEASKRLNGVELDLEDE